MTAHTVYAEVYSGKVKNIIVCDDYEEANRIAKATYGQSAFAVEVTQIPVVVGDTWKNGFFHEVKPGKLESVAAVPTERQEIETLKQQNEALTLALAEMIGGRS